jgi:hypothetical protein
MCQGKPRQWPHVYSSVSSLPTAGFVIRNAVTVVGVTTTDYRNCLDTIYFNWAVDNLDKTVKFPLTEPADTCTAFWQSHMQESMCNCHRVLQEYYWTSVRGQANRVYRRIRYYSKPNFGSICLTFSMLGFLPRKLILKRHVHGNAYFQFLKTHQVEFVYFGHFSKKI